jgi:hypothetical protein
MTDRELMQQTLEVLVDINKLSVGENAISLPAEIDWAMDALRERLAQPEQEPVAYSYKSRITGAQGFSHHPMPRFIDADSWDIKPLYTTPPASKPWVGLTDEEQQKLYDEWIKAGDGWGTFYALIEAKLKEKNL